MESEYTKDFNLWFDRKKEEFIQFAKNTLPKDKQNPNTFIELEDQFEKSRAASKLGFIAGIVYGKYGRDMLTHTDEELHDEMIR